MNIEELNHKLKKYKTKARYNPENYLYQQKIEYYNNLVGGANISIDEQLKNYLNLESTQKNNKGEYKIIDKSIDIFYLDIDKIIKYNEEYYRVYRTCE
jgi:hypothetical protein